MEASLTGGTSLSKKRKEAFDSRNQILGGKKGIPAGRLDNQKDLVSRLIMAVKGKMQGNRDFSGKVSAVAFGKECI